MYKEIEKLFNAKIPIISMPQLSEYFLNRQIKTLDYDNILNFITLYKNKYNKNYKEYIKDKNIIFEFLLNKIKNSDIENLMKTTEVKLQNKIKNKNNVIHILKNQKEDKTIIGFDIKEGNFNAYKFLYHKILSKEEKEKIKDKTSKLIINKETFKEFAKELLKENDKFKQHIELIDILISSKSFRQNLFGNLTPKENTKILMYITLNVAETLKEFNTEILIESQDEKLYLLDEKEQSKFKEQLLEKNNEFFNILRIEEKEIELIEELKSISTNKGKLYYKERVKTKNNWKLKGVPKKLYIPMYIKYIEEEEIKEKDLYTEDDGNIYKLILNYK
jgi:hypothetical protein